MKLANTGWKKAACFCLVAIIAFMGIKSTCLAAKASVKYDSCLRDSEIENIVCTPKSITVSGYIGVWSYETPTGVEIYRAKIKANGKRGSFKRIKVLKKFKQDTEDETKWHFTYKDTTVKAGQSYVYKCRGFRKIENVKYFQEKNFKTRKGVAANGVGKYTCGVARNTQNELIIKITGKDRNNGLLECYVDELHSHSVFLVCKNKGNREVTKSLAPQAYSYNGKKWYSEPNFHIKGKESVYLRFNGEDIDVSNYQYVQMIMGYMRYNLCPWNDSDTSMPQIRFNLTSGKALTGNFIKWDSYKNDWITEWGGGIFEFDIPAAEYNRKLLYSQIETPDCTPESITFSGYVGTDMVELAGVEIYRAEIKADGKAGSFKRIGACKKFEQNIINENEWCFTYEDSTVKIGQAYVYKCRGFIETGNVKRFQAKNSETRKGVAANAVGKYTCEVIQNTSDELIIKITGKDKNNGPLGCYVDASHFSSGWLAYKNEGETEIVKFVTPQEYSYNGKKWYTEPRFSIKGKESIYLRFRRGRYSDEDIDLDISGYQYVQIIVQYMTYNLCPWSERAMPQLRLNLTSGEALVDDFIIWDIEKQEWRTEWDGDIFEFDAPMGDVE